MVLLSSNVIPGCDNNSASIGRGFQCERSALGGRAMHLGSTCGTFLTKSANSHILLGRGKSFGRMSGFIRKYLSVCFAMRDQPTIGTLLTLLGTQEASRHHHVGGFPHRFPHRFSTQVFHTGFHRHSHRGQQTTRCTVGEEVCTSWAFLSAGPLFPRTGNRIPHLI